MAEKRRAPIESPARIAIFAPSPVLTVTIETSGSSDDDIHLHAGGQGVWVGRMAALLGAEVTLCSALGGEAGCVLEALIRSQGQLVRPVPAAAPNGAYLHDRRGGKRKLIATVRSPVLKRHEIDQLYGAMTVAALASDVAVLTCTEDARVLAGDHYRRLAADLRRNEVPVIADLTGDALQAALAGGVSVLKLSHEELAKIASQPLDSPLRFAAEISLLVEGGADNVVISRASEPAIASIDSSLFELRGPTFEPLDHQGAGDSMVAALAVGMARGLDVPEALKMAVAAGALNVTRHGLGSGARGDIEQLAGAVKVQPLHEIVDKLNA